MVSASYIGPLPPPSILRQYDEICPGCAKELVSAFREEGNHRRALESKMVEANIDGMRRQFAEARIGQIFAFILSLAFLFTGAYTAIRGHSWVGGFLGAMGIGSIPNIHESYRLFVLELWHSTCSNNSLGNLRFLLTT